MYNCICTTAYVQVTLIIKAGFPLTNFWNSQGLQPAVARLASNLR
jgi:hypothetical protein